MDIVAICVIIVFGVSSIALAWEKQQEKYHRRHREWMKKNKEKK